MKDEDGVSIVEAVLIGLKELKEKTIMFYMEQKELKNKLSII